MSNKTLNEDFRSGLKKTGLYDALYSFMDLTELARFRYKNLP